MGNAQSQKNTAQNTDMFFNKELIDSIDHLASKLIFEQSFQKLSKLNDPKYCDEVSVLTQRLLKKKLKPINVNVVATRVKYGNQDIYAITNEDFENLKTVDDINEKNYNKNEMCLNVSKFYTKIFQTYCAIVTAINPVYVYKDIAGEKKIKSVFDDISSENKNRSSIGLRSLCSRRIFYLKPRKMGEKEMTLKVNTCKMNVKGRDIPYLTREHVEHRNNKLENLDQSKELKNSEIIENVVQENQNTEVKNEVEEQPKEDGETQKEGEEPQKEGEEPQNGGGEPQNEGEEPQKEGEEPKNEDGEPQEEVQVENNELVIADINDKKESNIGDKPVTMDDSQVKMISDIIETMSLADEPGIVSLENLYKDVMKIKTDNGKLKGEFEMSTASKKKYKKDLNDFYEAFVPNGSDIGSIEKFSDIKLTDFTKSKECSSDAKVPWGKTIVGDTRKQKDSLFVKYGKHFQTMIARVKERENELIGLLQELFDFDLEKDIPIKIKGNLTEDKLTKEVMPKVMKTIKTMYIDCEKDFQNGIKIYNDIYLQRNNL